MKDSYGSLSPADVNETNDVWLPLFAVCWCCCVARCYSFFSLQIVNQCVAIFDFTICISVAWTESNLLPAIPIYYTVLACTSCLNFLIPTTFPIPLIRYKTIYVFWQHIDSQGDFFLVKNAAAIFFNFSKVLYLINQHFESLLLFAQLL